MGWGATDIEKCIQLYGLLILSLTMDESRSLHFLLIAISFNRFVKVLNLACDLSQYVYTVLRSLGKALIKSPEQ